MMALLAVIMPRAWMNVTALWLGLDPLPSDPVVGYLARSASIMYALHGCVVFFISFDVVRYAPLIRLLACIAVLHGLGMLVVDIGEGLPRWWQWVEGPTFSLTGFAVLWLQKGAHGGTEDR